MNATRDFDESLEFEPEPQMPEAAHEQQLSG
jgi:hypothetical protein